MVPLASPNYVSVISAHGCDSRDGWWGMRPAAPEALRAPPCPPTTRYASRPVGYKEGVEDVDNDLRCRSQGMEAVDNAVGYSSSCAMTSTFTSALTSS